MRIFLYGPPGAGKTTVGKLLAAALELPFEDLDARLEQRAGQTIAAVFAGAGEPAFRRMEAEELRATIQDGAGVVSLGGGALLDPASRALAEASGKVVGLHAPVEVLAARMRATSHRPLLAENMPGRLAALLSQRGAHYDSFPLQVDTTHLTAEQAAWKAQICLGFFQVRGMGAGYPVQIENGLLDHLGMQFQQLGLHGPVALVSDQQVGRWQEPVVQAAMRKAGYACETILLPVGEAHKTMESVMRLWQAFLATGLERGSAVLALGGGVVTDLAGFAAATYLRGIAWVSAPTSLLGMVDAGLGGKTGADLPQGKNLVGAFYPPRAVVCDPRALSTLPEAELRNGLAEVVKHGVIGDEALFARCSQGWQALTRDAEWEALVRQAAAVKIQVLLEDPYERGRRAVLNFGHTLGHGLEKASEYTLRHGEAVALGMLIETRLAEANGIAEPGTAAAIEAALDRLGLPVRVPQETDLQRVRLAMRTDKKRHGGKLRLALPRRVGWVVHGFEFDEEELWAQCLSCMDPT